MCVVEPPSPSDPRLSGQDFYSEQRPLMFGVAQLLAVTVVVGDVVVWWGHVSPPVICSGLTFLYEKTLGRFQPGSLCTG